MYEDINANKKGMSLNLKKKLQGVFDFQFQYIIFYGSGRTLFNVIIWQKRRLGAGIKISI
jgi:ABC-type glucose/galactose transport system permease subunit